MRPGLMIGLWIFCHAPGYRYLSSDGRRPPLRYRLCARLMSDEVGKLYVTAASARGVSGRTLLWRYPARHALGPIINSLGFDLNRIFNELPIVALILTLTEAGALLIEALARSNDQQLAGAIIFLLTASIVGINFVTDMILALTDPRVRRSILA